MSYSITREDGTADAMALQDALNILKASKSWDSPATARLRELRDSIEEQVKPVPISEPDGFGSVVRAFVCGSNAEPWVRVRAGQFSEWANEHGSHVDWHRLCEPEVLRIGVGDDGLREAAARIVDTLDASPATAALVTARYPGLDHAIDLVRRHLPQSDGGAAAPPAAPTATPAATGGGLAAERATTTAAPPSSPDRPLSSFIHDTLVAHQRKDASSCLCGWSVWGASHALHVTELLLEGIDNSLFTEGFDVACNEIIKDLTRLRDEAITGERKDAYAKAIAAVAHQREWK